ncbi:MAG: hypothetical protein STSR0002_14430 [Smithella sp.]|jgi:hypothetical protein
MKRDNVFDKHPLILMILLLVIILFATDIIGKNVFKYYYKVQYKKNNHEKEYRIPSNYYHHDLKPNVSIPKNSWGIISAPVATNSLGFKDRQPRKISPSPDHYRILFIGDSFTEGVGISYEKTFVGIIDNELHKKNIEVLNAAVVSYSPSIYYAKVKYLIDFVGLHFDELVVFIDISDIGNEAIEYRLDGDRVVEREKDLKIKYDERNEKYIDLLKKRRTVYQKVEQILKRDTVMTYNIVKKIHDIFFSRDYSYDYDSVNLRGALWTTDKSIYDEFGKAGLDESAKNMDLLANLCRNKRITLTIAVYPWPDQIVRHDLNSIQSQFWKNWAKKHDVKFIDYFPYFISSNINAASVRSTLDSYFIAGDIHWNSEGHKKIADIFLHNYRPSHLKTAE